MIATKSKIIIGSERVNSKKTIQKICEIRTPRKKLTRGMIRMEEKAQKKAELVPERSLIVGIDLSKKKHVVLVSNMQKKPLARFKVEHSKEGIKELLKRVEEIKDRTGSKKVVYSMEPTSHFWMNVATYLESCKQEYVLVQPLSVKHERNSTYYNSSKDDDRDSAMIVNLTVDKKFTYTQLPEDKFWAGYRLASKEYIELDQELIREHLKIQSYIERIYPDYGTVFKDTSSKTVMSCMLAINVLEELDEAEFLLRVKNRSEGRIMKSKILEFHDLAIKEDKEWGALVYKDGIKDKIAHSAERYKLLQKQQEEVLKKLLNYYEKTKYSKHLDTIPHLSPMIHALTLGIIGDPKKYDTSRCLLKYAGLDIKFNESGKHKGRTGITNVGDPDLRYLSYIVGFTTKTHDAVSIDRYNYLINRKSNPLKKNQALIALGCKYFRILWTMSATETDYNIDKSRYGEYNHNKDVLARQ
jgi:transposase